MKYKPGHKFMLNHKIKAHRDIKNFSKEAGLLVFEIEGFELSHEGKIGYRLRLMFSENQVECPFVYWWVDDTYLDQEFTKLEGRELRFILLAVE